MLNMELEAQSAERATAYLFRMSADDKARLKAEAAAADMTVQQLFELKLLGAPKPRVRMGRPPKRDQEEELPIAG